MLVEGEEPVLHLMGCVGRCPRRGRLVDRVRAGGLHSVSMTSLPDPLLSFAEDPGAFVAIGPDEERILGDRYCVTFSPGGHFWSTSVERLRFWADEVEAGVAEIRDLMTARGRKAAAWRVGPSSTPQGLHDLLLGLGMESESDESSVILVLTEPPRVTPSPFDVRLVSTYKEHLAAIEVGRDRKSTRLNSSHSRASRMPSSA